MPLVLYSCMEKSGGSAMEALDRTFAKVSSLLIVIGRNCTMEILGDRDPLFEKTSVHGVLAMVRW